MTKIKEKEKAFIDANYKGASSRRMVDLLYEATGTLVNHNAILFYYKKMGYKSGVDGRFKKGFAGMSEEKINNIKSTQYKKGHVPHNTQPIGATSDRCDGYKFIKVGNRKWKTEQVIVWEKANGKVPKRHKILHLDGNSLNNRLDNLMLISDSESVTINGYGLTKDADINKAIVLTSRLKKALGEKNDC